MLETVAKRKRRPRVLVAAVAVLLLVAAAWVGWPAPLPDRYPPAPDAPDNHVVWVVSHGWHTGIVVNRAEALGVLRALDTGFHDARFLEIGWGDEGFYTAPNGAITVGLALEAMLSSRGSVLHVVGLPAPPPEVFPRAQVQRLVVSDAGFRAMLAAMGESFRRDRGGRGIPLRRGIYGDSLFFMGLGRYSALYTCNSWTAQMLRETGCPISAPIALTAGIAMLQAGALCTGS